MSNVGTILLLGALVMIVAGVVVLAVASPLVGGVLIVVGLADLAMAGAFRSGMLGD